MIYVLSFVRFDRKDDNVSIIVIIPSVAIDTGPGMHYKSFFYKTDNHS